MSRVGKYPVVLPQGVTFVLEGQKALLKGPKGENVLSIPREVTLEHKEGKLFLVPVDKSSDAQRLWGTTRSLLQNLVKGVFEGFTVNLEIEGVGYRASVQGSTLKLQMGFSHDIDFPIPQGMEIKCDRPTQISIWGIDNQKVGQVAANIQAFRPPEPYKGKGIRRVGRFVFRKEGKKK
ncbi:MAG: 50S ribosomal protein L6 [Holosporales bacterium]|nr:50S ribosomal protein L6 [Holosporales bacterium]